MDHNLGDDLNLEPTIGVDFEQPEDAVVHHTDIVLGVSGHEGVIPMDFEHIEEQPLLMDTGSEEIIDFMGEQFTLQEYAQQEDQNNILTTTMGLSDHNIFSSQSDTMIEIETEPHRTMAKHQDHALPKMVTSKPELSPPRGNKKNETEVYTSAPRQVAIAPKPAATTATPKAFMPGKQFAIAPKPIALLTGKNNSLLKKVTLAGVMQGNTKGNTVFTQFGKQLVMMPAAGAQKLKLLTTGTSVPTVQYIPANAGDQNKNITSHNKPVITKLLLQGQQNLDINNPQTLVTKVSPLSNPKTPQFVTVQQKTMPLTLGNKVVLATPTKSGVKFAKKQQIIAFKSPEKVSQTAQGSSTKKVLITSNPSQNVIVKTTGPSKITKHGNIVLEGPRSQLHQINVPGKGIQYIRLITNSSQGSVKPKLLPQTINMPNKTFLLSDNKVSSKPQKLVRIAPMINKPAQPEMTRKSSQSLLAPLSPTSELSGEVSVAHEEMDSKSALQALVADVLRHEGMLDEQQDMQADIHPDIRTTMQSAMHVDGQADMQVDTNETQITVTEVEVEFKRDFYSDCDENNDKIDQNDLSGTSEEHPLIVIPSNFRKEKDANNLSDSQSGHEESQRMIKTVAVDADALAAFHSPPPTGSEDIISTDLGLRLRKACNCTKSQCLKLYCECFANGEFCNQCNCTNCHNNLENEERRQKAIRGCLDRNPNAFRPKIGKAKLGGPEMIRRHNKGCNCKRSGCLKNYCECYEAKIACTSICKCVGCRNVEEILGRTRRRTPAPTSTHTLYRPAPLLPLKQPCSFMTTEVVEAVCQCLLAAGGEAVGDGKGGEDGAEGRDAVRDVIDEFARCLQDIISAAQHSSPLMLLDEVTE